MLRLILLILPVLLFAGRTSQWSGSFTLHEVNLTASEIKSDRESKFDITAHPNPFNPSTVLNVNGIASNTINSLQIFNIEGKIVRNLTQELNKGSGTIIWNATGVSAGIYVVKLISGSKSKNMKIVLIR